MTDIVRARSHAHVWVVGLTATVWNGFGAYDYLMTQTGNEAYLSQFSAEEQAYFEAFPAWAELLWALGVWGGLLGSLLLIARSRYAVHAFSVSLLGMIGSFAYQLTSEVPASLETGAMTMIPWLIMGIGVALFLYALEMVRRGGLR